MDDRKSLRTEYTLHVHNADRGMVTYTISGETGRGASCIVYEAYYRNNAGARKTVRLKECCPLKLHPVRQEDGSLQVTAEQESMFEQSRQMMREAFRINNLFFDTVGLTNKVTNTIDLYEANNTVYIAAAYEEGSVPAYHDRRTIDENLHLVKSAAGILQKMHAAGYLYLDMKPDNVLIVDDENMDVRLFDFDSLYPISRIQISESVNSARYSAHKDPIISPEDLSDNDPEYARFAFTKGFSAYELRSGRISQIGPWTDVYGIGALLFYLLFGRTPEAPDSDEDAVYDYRQASFSPDEYPDRLVQALTEFFHRTIAGYYLDRCQDMGSVIHLLDNALSYADRSRPFLCSDYIGQPVFFRGREKEQRLLEQWWEKDPGTSACLVVTGMGGIGKSTLARQFIARLRDGMSAVVYLSSGKNICRQIADDGLVKVHLLQKNAAETGKEYFLRKTGAIRKILHTAQSGKTLLVLDNFEPESFSELKQIISIGWKILVLSRHSAGAELYESISLNALGSPEEQEQVFEHALGYRIPEEEKPVLRSILKLLNGHTLAIELTAKQIAAGSITLTDAEKLIRKQGFSDIGSEKIDYVRDLTWQKQHVKRIIGQLFAIRKLSLTQRRILCLLTLYDEYGVNITELMTIFNNSEFSDPDSDCSQSDSSDSFSAMRILSEEGLLMISPDQKILKLHPVIAEVVREWTWDGICLEDTERLMQYYIMKLKRISFSDPHQLPAAQGKPDTAALRRKMHSVLDTAELILRKAERISSLKNMKSAEKLLCSTVLHMPWEREDFILRQGTKFIRLSSAEERDAMLVLERMLSVLLERGDFSKAEKLLKYAAQKAGPGFYCRGICSYMKCDYFDYLLDGEYDIHYERGELKECIRSLKHGIQYFRLAGREASVRRFRCLISLSSILIRSTPEKQKMIRENMGESIRLLRSILNSEHNTLSVIEENIDPCGCMNPMVQAELLISLYMTEGWYYTYVERDVNKVKQLTAKACRLAGRAWYSEIEEIDMVLVPAANMLFELYNGEPAIEYLENAVQICDRHPDIIPFMRKKNELHDHIRQVRDLYKNE